MAAPRRASRRPGRWLVAAVLVTLAVLITNAAVRSRPNPAETLLAYLDQIRPDVQRPAAEDARTAMTAALAEGPADPVVQGLVSVGQDIGLGDRSYQLFAASFPTAP